MPISNKDVTRFIDGNQDATGKIYLEYKNLMFFVIASYITNKQDCEDVLSESFLKAIEHRKEIRNKEGIKAFLTTIAKNTALDFIRKTSSIIPSDTIDEIYGEDDRKNEVLDLFEPLLSNKETIVIYLKIGFSYTWEEISKETGISESTARRLYAKAKEKLRKGWGR